MRQHAASASTAARFADLDRTRPPARFMAVDRSTEVFLEQIVFANRELLGSKIRVHK